MNAPLRSGDRQVDRPIAIWKLWIIVILTEILFIIRKELEIRAAYESCQNGENELYCKKVFEKICLSRKDGRTGQEERRGKHGKESCVALRVEV